MIVGRLFHSFGPVLSIVMSPPQGLCPGGQFRNIIPPDRPGQASVRQLQSPY